MSLTPKGNTTRRNRISLAQELRIWDLRRQGYRLDEVAKICNLPWQSVATAAYRAKHHWKHQGDPRLGRQRGWQQCGIQALLQAQPCAIPQGEVIPSDGLVVTADLGAVRAQHPGGKGAPGYALALK